MTPEQEKIVEWVTCYVREHLPDKEGLDSAGFERGVQVAAIDIQKAMTYKSARVLSPRLKINVNLPDPEECKKWAEMAESDPAAWSACISVCASLNQYGLPLPAPLAEFSGKVLRGSIKKPADGGKRSKYYLLARDIIVCQAISMLKGSGIPVKSDSKRSRAVDACKILAPTLNLTANAVWKIWENQKAHRDRIESEGRFYIEETGEVEYLKD